MNQHVVIRDDTDPDFPAITEVTIAAFNTLKISNKTEHYIIDALRVSKALTVSLVAEVDGHVVGPCLLPRHHFRWFPELVWAWACFSVAGLPA